jgi:hypothetical protein
MCQNAIDNNVELDPKIVERAFLQKNRLLAEKELRQLLANITIDMSSQENLDNLTEKVENAKKCNVAEQYVSSGSELAEKISLNLDAKDILQKFLEYPIRVYPEVEVVDPKNKSKLLLYNNIINI